MADTPNDNTPQSLVSIIDTQIIDNDTGAIDPAVMRAVLKAIALAIPLGTSPNALTASLPLLIDGFTGNLSLNETLLKNMIPFGKGQIFKRSGNVNYEAIQTNDIYVGFLPGSTTVFIPFGKYLGGGTTNIANYETSPIDF